MLKVLSLFSGIGAFEKALTRQKIDFELVNYCDIDKYASASYSAIHNVSEDLNLWDITQVNPHALSDFDLVTYGFPCQDISVSGQQRGLDEGTRSSLYTYAVDIIRTKKPKYAVMENVKNLVSKKFISYFEAMLEDLEGMGYTNYWKIINSKNQGVPQNRERVFLVSILGEHKPFEFPEDFDNGLRLKDLLECDVDEKYYINEDKCKKLLENLNNQDIVDKLPKGEAYKVIGTVQNKEAKGTNSRAWVYDPDYRCSCLSATEYKDPKLIAIKKEDNNIKLYNLGNVNPSGKGMNGDVYHEEGLSPTISTNKGEGSKVLVSEVKQEVNVRKYQVDIEGLKKCLKTHKKLSNYNNEKLSKKLNVSKTTVEHWFRTDKWFNVPDADIWYKLKQCLNIETDEFDKSITTFETREGVYEKADRLYWDVGLIPTLTSDCKNLNILTHQVPAPKLLGGIGEINFGKQYRQENRIYDAESVAMCLLSQPVGNAGGNSYLYAVSDPKVIQVGKIEGKHFNQNKIVYDTEGISATLNGQGHSGNEPKIIENELVKHGSINNCQSGNVFDENGVSTTLCANGGGMGAKTGLYLLSNYRIRKLTPKECWRLQGFDDEDYERARDRLIEQHYNGKDRASTQLYKQAGNSITVNVLEGIFNNLLKNRW